MIEWHAGISSRNRWLMSDKLQIPLRPLMRQADSSIAKEKPDELVSLTSSLKATMDELGVKIEEVDAHAGDFAGACPCL
jgi:hypothetical protein